MYFLGNLDQFHVFESSIYIPCTICTCIFILGVEKNIEILIDDVRNIYSYSQKEEKIARSPESNFGCCSPLDLSGEERCSVKMREDRSQSGTETGKD